MNDQRFELLIGILTSFTLPFVVIGGIFGMNLEDLPVKVKFWELLGNMRRGISNVMKVLLF